VPSAWSRSFAGGELEAFSHKAPVVGATIWARSPRLIAERRRRIAASRTEDELIAALGRIAQDPRLRSELAENGHRMVAGRWGEAAYLRRYFDLLSGLAMRKFGEISMGGAGRGSGQAGVRARGN
jgi:hypothetical protein